MQRRLLQRQERSGRDPLLVPGFRKTGNAMEAGDECADVDSGGVQEGARAELLPRARIRSLQRDPELCSQQGKPGRGNSKKEGARCRNTMPPQTMYAPIS